MGIAAAIVYVTIGRRRVDYRFVLLGAVLPDLIDGASCAFYDCGGGRGAAHSLIANVAVTVQFAVTAAVVNVSPESEPLQPVTLCNE